MVYQITVTKLGVKVGEHEGIEAPDPLSAIARIEGLYGELTPVSLSGKGGEKLSFVWGGYEFLARRLEMYLN